MPIKMPKSHCPINFALERFGDKWTLLIIRDLLFFGKNITGILSIRPKEFIARLKKDKTGVSNEFVAAIKKRKA